MTLKKTLVALTVLCLLMSLKPLAAQTPGDLRSYVAQALVGRDGQVQKWPGPVVTWAVAGTYGQAAEPFIRKVFAELSAYTTVRFVEVGQVEADIVYYSGRATEQPFRADMAGNLAFTETTRSGGELLKAEVWLPRDTVLGPYRDSAIRHETLHALGWEANFSTPRLSVLSAGPDVSGYQVLDILLFITLYGPYGEPGLSAEQVLAAYERTRGLLAKK